MGRALGLLSDGFTLFYQWWDAMQSDASSLMLMWFCWSFVLTVAVVEIFRAEPTPASSAMLCYVP